MKGERSKLKERNNKNNIEMKKSIRIKKSIVSGLIFGVSMGAYWFFVNNDNPVHVIIAVTISGLGFGFTMYRLGFRRSEEKQN